MGKRMLDASTTCLTFCEEFGNLTDPELWVMSDNGFLSSIVDGDNSKCYMYMTIIFLNNP